MENVPGLRRLSRTLITHDVPNAVVELGRLVRSNGGAHSADDHEERDDDSSQDDELTSNRTCLAKLSPGHGALAQVVLELLATELVVDQAAQSDAVAERLEKTDGVLEEHHGGKDEENVLEHTGERENKGRGLANLILVSANPLYHSLLYIPGRQQKR